jgi:diguanylate cyclase (GGDEF)-like protein/PAS domain S-box-containing protein
MLCALLLLPPVIPSARERLKFSLDAATVVVGGAMVLWRFVAVPALSTPFVGSDFASVVRLAHPIGDLCLLLGVASVLLRCPRGARRPPLLLLVASQAVLLLSDGAWTRGALTSVDAIVTLETALQLLAGVLLAAALLLEDQRLSRHQEEVDATPRAFMALPYAAVVAGYGVLVLAAVRSLAVKELEPLIVGAACLAVFVLARQILAVRENISLLRERTILASEARFKALIQHASDIVTIVDATWVISFVSPSATRTLGYPASELAGVSFLGLLHHDDTVDCARRLRESLLDPTRVMTARWRLRRNDGTFVETDTICTNLTFDENIRGLVLTTRDVSERCSLEAQLRHQAFHDPLTGLANRALFQDRVQHALSRRRGELETLGVVFVDLDNFKTVNDSLGHSIGDLLLRAAAQRLVSCLRAFDTAARLGGDEFAILIDDTQRYEDVPQVADRVTKAFLAPFVIDGREVTTTASVGVALAMSDQSAEDLLRNADLAMYLAKSRGRGQAALFEPSMHAAAVDRLELQNDLRHALERNELVVVYQPVHALESQVLVGAEALLRWMHPTRGPIPPTTFVPIAEETGLIVPIGRWVLQRACRDAVRWRSRTAEGAGLRVSVNMSSRQIPDVDLLDDIRSALETSGLPAGAVVLELTESMLLQHTAAMMTLMHQLRALGVRLAIDDFGTGYSSLSYLQRLPIDILKIDRAFVERLGADTSAAALVRAIVSLGESMSLKTIAEGIESAQQAERLRGLGCDFGQGFFYGMPMSAEELERYVDRSAAVGVA